MVIDQMTSLRAFFWCIDIWILIVPAVFGRRFEYPELPLLIWEQWLHSLGTMVRALFIQLINQFFRKRISADFIIGKGIQNDGLIFPSSEESIKGIANHAILIPFSLTRRKDKIKKWWTPFSFFRTKTKQEIEFACTLQVASFPHPLCTQTGLGMRLPSRSIELHLISDLWPQNLLMGCFLQKKEKSIHHSEFLLCFLLIKKKECTI